MSWRKWPRVIIKIAVALVLVVFITLPYPVEAAPDTVTLRPSGAGDEAILTLVGDTANYLCVDEATSDEDGTYVWSDASAYEGDLYALEDVTLAGKGTINSVTVWVNVKSEATKSGVGARTSIKTNSVVYPGADISITPSWATSSTAYATNPQTGVAWTWAEVNALQAGVDLQKVRGNQAWCTQVWVVVDYTPVTDWNSYSDSGHTTPCEFFETSTNVVYMKGENFASGTIKVAYYDAVGDIAETDTYIAFAGGTLTSDCVLNQAWGEPPPEGDGYWHAVVIQTGDLIPDTYAQAIADSNYVIDDDFYVASSAIPEFPTVIAAIGVAGLCFASYYWLRKRRLVYVQA